MSSVMPKVYDDLTESDLRALQALIEQRNLVGPGHFGSLLWPNSERRGSNCSAPLARSAGKVLNRLRSANCAEYVYDMMRGNRGWQATVIGKDLHTRYGKKRKR